MYFSVFVNEKAVHRFAMRARHLPDITVIFPHSHEEFPFTTTAADPYLPSFATVSSHYANLLSGSPSEIKRAIPDQDVFWPGSYLFFFKQTIFKPKI
ncbi:MAG: hypothetical protein Q8N87_02100 [bacterium]|nr:hypothetical protein [bacterium]